MKENISIDKDRIKLMSKGKKITIPFDTRKGKPWDEPYDEDVDICQLYQIMQNNEDTIEPITMDKYI